MNTKQELKKKQQTRANYRWIIQITVIALIISFAFSFLSETILPNVSLWVGIIIVFLFILLGILFDIIGVAVTSADEAPFHSMSSRKVKAARMAVKLKKSADKVSSFCNDVIGDICGIISGSAGVMIAVQLSDTLKTNLFFTTLVITALIAAFTIGGKAMGKSFAINKGNYILYEFAKILSWF